MTPDDRSSLSETRTRPDGRLAFRLLSVSLPEFELPDGARVRLEDIVEALVENDDGVPCERPVATVRVGAPGAQVRAVLEPGQEAATGGGRLRLEYALDGESPGLPKQYYVHFTWLAG